MAPSIIHLNIADFAVAVERNRDPSLRRYPVIVAPKNMPRTVVYDMSEEAYQMGVRKGAPLKRALRMVPGARVLPPSRRRYEEAMQDLFQKVSCYTPLVEYGRGDGHFFMDVSGTSRLFGPARDVANRLRQEIKKTLCFNPVWSVATNRLVAKVATRVVKPFGEYTVEAGDEEKFLAPLSIRLLPGVKKEEIQLFSRFNIRTVSQARALNADQLQIPFETRAEEIYKLVRGRESTRISPVCQPEQTVSARYEFDIDTNSIYELKKGLHSVVASVCHDLRNRGMSAGRIGLGLFYSDAVENFSQAGIVPGTANDFIVFENAAALLHKVWNRRVRIRHLELACIRPVGMERQMSLFPSRENRENRYNTLVSAVDKIRARFGRDSVMPGTCLPA